MNRFQCWPNCNIAVGNRRWPASTSVSMPCPSSRTVTPIEFTVNIHLPGQRQRSTFPLRPERNYDIDFESHLIGSDSYLANLDVKFTERNSDEFHVNACITPQDSNRVCFMDQIITKREAFEQYCGNIREPGGVSFLFMSALLVFVCLLIGMASTVLIYRLYRRFRERRPREPIICEPSTKLSTCSIPRPFHAQLTVVMEEEEEKCSPSTPIKDFFWRSSSPTPSNTPKGTKGRSSPILANFLPGKKPTPKPTMV